MSKISSGEAIDLLEEEIKELTSEEAIELLEEKKKALEAELEAYKSSNWTKVASIHPNNHNLRIGAEQDYIWDFNRINNVIVWAKQKIEELKGKSPVGGKRNRKNRRKTRRNRRSKKRNTRKFK